WRGCTIGTPVPVALAARWLRRLVESRRHDLRKLDTMAPERYRRGRADPDGDPGRRGTGTRATPATGPLTTVIVQFDAEPVVSVAATGGVVDAQADARIRQARQAVARTENAVLEAAEAAGIEVEHRRSYDVLLPGMSVNVPTDQVDDLRRLPGVAAVHENRTFRASTVDSVPLIGAPEVWERTDPDGLPARGAGVTVAVIDTGIDYTHPALGG